MLYPIIAMLFAKLVEDRPELQEVLPNATPTPTALASFGKILAKITKADTSLAICQAWNLPVPSKHVNRCGFIADYVLRSHYRIALSFRTGLLTEVEGRTGRPTHSHTQVGLDDDMRKLLAGDVSVIVWDNNGIGFDSGLPLARLHVKSSLKRLGASTSLAMRRGTPQGEKGASNTPLPFAFIAMCQEDIDLHLAELVDAEG